MNVAKDLLELYVNINVMLGFALLLWFALKFGFQLTGWRLSYGRQINMLKGLLILVAVSPFLAHGVTALQQVYMPGQSIVLSDIVVAAYLRGDIAMDAIQFEAMLNTRSAWTDGFLTLGSPVFAVMAVVLILGIGLFVLRFLRSVRYLHGVLSDSYLVKRLGPVDIRVSEQVTVPMAARGLFRRHVILPYDLDNSGRDRRIALAHELQHFRHFDLEWEITLEALRPLVFWNPAFALLKREFDRLRELSCDEAVLQRRGLSAFDYALCLLRFCEKSVAIGAKRPLDVALVPSCRKMARRNLAERILSLRTSGPVHRAPYGLGLVFAIAMVVAFGVFGASIQTHKDWSHDRLMLSTVVNLERLEVINRGF